MLVESLKYVINNLSIFIWTWLSSNWHVIWRVYQQQFILRLQGIHYFPTWLFSYCSLHDMDLNNSKLALKSSDSLAAAFTMPRVTILSPESINPNNSFYITIDTWNTILAIYSRLDFIQHTHTELIRCFNKRFFMKLTCLSHIAEEMLMLIATKTSSYLLISLPSMLFMPRIYKRGRRRGPSKFLWHKTCILEHHQVVMIVSNGGLLWALF